MLGAWHAAVNFSTAVRCTRAGGQRAHHGPLVDAMHAPQWAGSMSASDSTIDPDVKMSKDTVNRVQRIAEPETVDATFASFSNELLICTSGISYYSHQPLSRHSFTSYIGIHSRICIGL